MLGFEEAAQRRAVGVAQRSHRPQRRSPETGGRVAFRAEVSITEGDVFEFDGYASVYEQSYEMADVFGPYREVVTVGAAAQSLARADLDVPMVLGHDQLRRIARTTNGTLRLSEDDRGLRVNATLDPADADVAYIAPKLRAGLIDEMSFAFRITSGVWSPDFTEFRIDRVDLHRGDVAIVGFGANPHTSGSGLRADMSGLRARLALAAAL